MTDAKNYEILLKHCFKEEAFDWMSAGSVTDINNYHDIVSYRRFEIAVFFAQVFSLFFYVLFCKAYVMLKNMCNKDKKKLQ
jgi:hypothetical protein